MALAPKVPAGNLEYSYEAKTYDGIQAFIHFNCNFFLMSISPVGIEFGLATKLPGSHHGGTQNNTGGGGEVWNSKSKIRMVYACTIFEAYHWLGAIIG